MPDRTWKARERAVARVLRGRRIPVTGIDRHGADVLTPLLAVQVKHGRRRPGFLRANGLMGSAVPPQRPDASGAEGVVILRLADFEALHGRIATPSDGPP